MKATLLKKLRKKYRIEIRNGDYRLTYWGENKSATINTDFYKNIRQCLNMRRKLILNSARINHWKAKQNL